MEHARTMRALAGPPSQDRSSRLDWGRIEAWAQQVARGDLGEVNAVCEANGALAPRVLWQPTSSQIHHAGTVGGILHGAVPIGAGGLPIGLMRF